MKVKAKEIKIHYLIITIAYSILLIWEMFFGQYRIHSEEIRYNIMPFKSMAEFIQGANLKSIVINIIGNIAVFIPFGILIPKIFKIESKNVRKFILISVFILIILEIMQMFLKIGVFDVDDIILNISGIIIGCIILKKRKNIYETVILLNNFFIKEALSCIFPISVFIILAITKIVKIEFIYRYDLILLLCIITQVLLIIFKIETIDEFKVICLFHLIGLILEIYKVNMGSWTYPEKSLIKIAGVPLYSGFMYSSVASYICQAWKRFELEIIYWPDKRITLILALLIYLNFFTHHYIFDMRWIIIGSLFIIYKKTGVIFRVKEKQIFMPIILSFFLIGIFIWIAENISTYLGAWKYPNQILNWQLVHTGKITSWFLLVIISIIIVYELKFIKYKDKMTGGDYGERQRSMLDVWKRNRFGR